MPRTPPTPHAAPDTPDSPQRETLAALAPPCTTLSKKPENDGQGTHEHLSLSLSSILISNFRRPSTRACYISSVSRGSSKTLIAALNAGVSYKQIGRPKCEKLRAHHRGRTGGDHNIGLSNDDSDQKPGTRDFYLLSRTAIKIHFNTTV